MGFALYRVMTRGEEAPLALLSGMSSEQMVKQLTREARLNHQTVMTHLARLERAEAVRALEDELDAHRTRVRPAMRDQVNLDLFGGPR
jgi:DNA-binding transcriptional ArsR family regulator